MTSPLKKAIRNPRQIPEWIYQCVDSSVIKPLSEAVLNSRYKHPTNQLLEDWDNLIILDACRYDTFENVSDLDGKLDYRISPASATIEWLNTTVKNRTFYHTVYISANPRLTRYENQFYAVDHVWNWGWDDDLKVTPPAPVADAMMEAQEMHPDKRLVAHFMQPHTPYIGDFARENIGIGTGDAGGRKRALGDDVNDDSWHHAIDRFENGAISRETVLKGYRENLSLVLDELCNLLPELSGKTVITADHGDMFGTRGWPYPGRVYDHPPKTPALGLRKVPWFIFPGHERREIVSEEPRRNDEFAEEHVTDRLQQLGYRE